MSEKEQEGILDIVATTAGIKLKISGVETNWINPNKDVVEELKARVEEMKKLKGRTVRITLDEDGKYTSLTQIDTSTADGEEEEVDALKKEEAQQELAEEEFIDAEEKEESPKETTGTETETVKLGDEISFDPANVTSTMFSLKTIPCNCNCHLDTLEEENKDYFNKLLKTAGDVKKLGHHNLTYMSWTDAWQKLKEAHPGATYKVWEDHSGMPYFSDKTGGFVKVTVRVCGVSHTVHLPVMDNKHAAVPTAKLDTFAINNTIQRCLCKAIAMHGMGLYVYKGEDLPEGDKK